jgi:hypothetical protein
MRRNRNSGTLKSPAIEARCNINTLQTGYAITVMIGEDDGIQKNMTMMP